MRNKYFYYALTALAGFLVGGICVLLFLQAKIKDDRFERAAVRLSFHVHLLETMQGKPPTSARQLVVHLADSDVLELMALEDRGRSQSARELNTRTFRVYAQIRNALPETHTVPAYVLDNERAEYLEKTRKIQQYLEGNSALQRP
jgi:hypothetical protein